jgi:DNA adenine methylase
LVCCSYDTLEIPELATIYADPPYVKTTKYKTDFDHDKFWNWCRVKGKEGHAVWVSEYSAPEDFKVVWEGTITSSLTKDSGAKRGVERLFRWTG